MSCSSLSFQILVSFLFGFDFRLAKHRTNNNATKLAKKIKKLMPHSDDDDYDYEDNMILHNKFDFVTDLS